MTLPTVTPLQLAINPQFTVTDGSTSVHRPATVRFDGATVAESPPGTALVTVEGGGSSSFITDSVVLSAADILAFDGTSGSNVIAVAAPGANKALIVVQAMAFLTAGGTPFADGGAIAFGTGTNGGLAESVLNASEVRSATSKAGQRWQNGASGSDLDQAVNAPLIANCYEGTFSAGNGHVEIAFVYYVHTMS